MSELMEVKALIEHNNKLLQAIESSLRLHESFMTIDQAAEFAKLSTQTIHKHKAAIGYSQPDRKVIIKKSDLVAWIENFRTHKIY